MSGIITTLKRENLQNLPSLYGDYVYPITVLDAVYDNNGNQIKINFEEINNNLGLLEEKLNSIQNTQSSINKTLTEVKNKNSNTNDLVNILENRVLAIEELRQNILSTATVKSTILTDINNMNPFTSQSGYSFNDTATVSDELQRIYNLLQEQFGDFHIGINGFSLLSYNANYYNFAIMKDVTAAFTNPLNWFIIDYKISQ